MPRRSNSEVVAVPDAHHASTFLIVRGVFTALFGILVLIWPGLTLVTLAILVTIWLIAVGAVSIVEGILSIGKGGWSWLLKIVVGVLEIGVGAYLVQRPGLTVATFVALIGLLLIVQGVVELVAAFVDGSNGATGRWLSVVVGVLSLVAGVWVWRYPVTGGLAFLWVLGLVAVIHGPMLIAAGIDLRNHSVRPA